ncbi:MAG: DUF1893 domain-containing protein [Ruminococcus sp.]|nr:DUF1893 domain-containing protein [Ruminococcus sp.]
MTDLERAKALFGSEGYTCVLCKGDMVYTSRTPGISPMLDYICNQTDLRGYSAADKIVGKAAAMLFALAGVTVLYAEVLSQSAVAVLERYGIRYSYGTLTDHIINRSGSGLCPMEEAVAEVEDLHAAFEAILNRLNQLRKERES